MLGEPGAGRTGRSIQIGSRRLTPEDWNRWKKARAHRWFRSRGLTGEQFWPALVEPSECADLVIACRVRGYLEICDHDMPQAGSEDSWEAFCRRNARSDWFLTLEELKARDRRGIKTAAEQQQTEWEEAARRRRIAHQEIADRLWREDQRRREDRQRRLQELVAAYLHFIC